jgi:hypothetical protein
MHLLTRCIGKKAATFKERSVISFSNAVYTRVNEAVV